MALLDSLFCSTCTASINVYTYIVSQINNNKGELKLRPSKRIARGQPVCVLELFEFDSAGGWRTSLIPLTGRDRSRDAGCELEVSLLICVTAWSPQKDLEDPVRQILHFVLSIATSEVSHGVVPCTQKSEFTRSRILEDAVNSGIRDLL